MKDQRREIVYSVTELMEIFNVSRRTIHRWIKKGLLKATKIGNEFRIPKKYYDEFIENITVVPDKK